MAIAKCFLELQTLYANNINFIENKIIYINNDILPTTTGQLLDGLKRPDAVHDWAHVDLNLVETVILK